MSGAQQSHAALATGNSLAQPGNGPVEMQPAEGRGLSFCDGAEVGVLGHMQAPLCVSGFPARSIWSDFGRIAKVEHLCAV